MEHPLLDEIRREIKIYKYALDAINMSSILSRDNLHQPDSTDPNGANIIRLAKDLQELKSLLKSQHMLFESVVEKLSNCLREVGK